MFFGLFFDNINQKYSSNLWTYVKEAGEEYNEQRKLHRELHEIDFLDVQAYVTNVDVQSPDEFNVQVSYFAAYNFRFDPSINQARTDTITFSSPKVEEPTKLSWIIERLE